MRVQTSADKTELFERMPVPRALLIMAVPTIISQLIALIYNIADTWFIGRAGNPYMVAASSLVLTVFLMAGAISNLFGAGPAAPDRTSSTSSFHTSSTRACGGRSPQKKAQPHRLRCRDFSVKILSYEWDRIYFFSSS